MATTINVCFYMESEREHTPPSVCGKQRSSSQLGDWPHRPMMIRFAVLGRSSLRDEEVTAETTLAALTVSLRFHLDGAAEKKSGGWSVVLPVGVLPNNSTLFFFKKDLPKKRHHCHQHTTTNYPINNSSVNKGKSANIPHPSQH